MINIECNVSYIYCIITSIYNGFKKYDIFINIMYTFIYEKSSKLEIH